MSISGELLKRVPIGEGNAVTGRILWRQLGMWSAASITKINDMAAAGLIERKRVWREMSRSLLNYVGSTLPE